MLMLRYFFSLAIEARYARADRSLGLAGLWHVAIIFARQWVIFRVERQETMH